MNLDGKKFLDFKIADIFIVKYGVCLDLNACNECDKNDENAVNFVSRTARNNGISAYVSKIKGVEPQKAGLISVAVGGSALSTFLQIEPFYSGEHLYILEAKQDISTEAKMFLISMIEQNKYKYCYGRQANKTLANLLLRLPINNRGEPDFEFMENYIKSLHYKPLTTKNRSENALALDTHKWGEFLLTDIFSIDIAKSADIGSLDNGDTIFIGRTDINNGVQGFVAPKDITKGNCITISMVGTNIALWQEKDFQASQNIAILRGSELNRHKALFICSLLNFDIKLRYSYGRTIKRNDLEKTIIKLPINHKGEPDFEFMENYIKSLPYGDRV
ncbi:restriction endonuclease subunit S [Campylobacter upsaliensis]|uniref:restriction endonuclease subunit S n=1 Tax=Campylobacter upsaliensis TaxID=28080 RepID=UPI002B3AF391|nr:restriction endonuclease subunit S [Campylobacter upsaliensis]MEB2816972.1 restriction endonuclease subunit S [Campylobacter upsaliensis]